MRYFIDTNVFLILCVEPDSLDSKLLSELEDYANQIIISAESIRELILLIKFGKIKVKNLCSYADIKAKLDEYGVTIRYVDESHFKTLEKIKPIPNHSDPADLMIIAQAMTENISIVSTDAKFTKYAKQGLKLIKNNR